MSKAYYYVQKRRTLKRKRKSSSSDDNHELSANEGPTVHNISNLSPASTVSVNSEVQFTDTSTCEDAMELSNSELDSNSDSTDNETNGSSDFECNTVLDVNQAENFSTAALSFKEKIKTWALANINTLNHSVISQLLGILRSEGYVNFPKTANALLGTESCISVSPMLTGRGNSGSYVYFGIQSSLEKKISPETYREHCIRIIVNVDGLPLYRNSRKQFWPISIQVYDKKYACSPIVVALYCGDSKPNSPEIFLHDFIEESIRLIEQGLIIGTKNYSFEILAFVCDTPARAFLKCCKSHTGFYSCERCVVKGVTVQKRRVYCQMDCALRTMESFRGKDQPEHHLENCTSPLLRIPHFDPVKSVVLDHMHLLYLGVMKSLIEKWLTGNNVSRIARGNRVLLKELLKTVSPNVTEEFQRKKFDSDDLANWKATQYRFFLLYCGALFSSRVLPKDKYRHFLLLYTSSRILCSELLAVKYSQYAGELLRKFFYLMPTLYGEESQVMNYHNLIHLADDVRHMKAPLTYYSAFPFENCLGFLKKLIRTPNKPLVQVAKRLSELEAERKREVRPHQLLRGCVRKKKFKTDEKFMSKTLHESYLQRINFKGFILSVVPPNNIVQLINGDIVKIKTICNKNNIGEIGINYLKLQGQVMKNNGDVFTYPCKSSLVGVIWVKNPTCEANTTFCATDIKTKCITLNLQSKICCITVLHQI